MCTVARLETAFSETKVIACGLRNRRDSGFVDDSFSQTFSFKRAFLPVSAITGACIGVRFWRQKFSIMAANDSCHIWHAAVTDFHRIPVEKLVIAMVLREMLIKQTEKLFGHICFNAEVKWWVNHKIFRFLAFF